MLVSLMSNLVEVSKTSELEDGAVKEILVRERAVLLARIGGSYYASDNRCPHMGGRLSKGKLEETAVTCPPHGSQFDLRNDQVVRRLKGSGLGAITLLRAGFTQVYNLLGSVKARVAAGYPVTGG